MTASPSDSQVHFLIATAPSPGAIAIVQLMGPGVPALLAVLTGRPDWPTGKLRLVNLGGMDTAPAVLLRDGPQAWAELFPHGGPRVVQKLCARLIELGATSPPNRPARAVYPEAGSDLEADMLAALAQAASPAAIDLLLAQPSLWKQMVVVWLAEAPPSSPIAAALGIPAPTSPLNLDHSWPDYSPFRAQITAILQQSAILDRLIKPPTVAVVGRSNVGKSTLSNRVLGRSASVVADMPGTTRDWVAGLAEIRSVALRWLDTPGLRHSVDAIEQQAIALALDVIQHADVLVALRDPQLDWPQPASLPRTPDLWVMGKSDLAAAFVTAGTGRTSSDPLAVSAITGAGIDQLELAVLQHLQLANPPLAIWAFSPALRRFLATGDLPGLRAYAGM